MKSLTCLNLLVSIAALVLCVLVTANEITWSDVLPHERLLGSKSIDLPGRWFTISNVDISYPSKSNSYPGILSRIVVKDWGSPQNFAYFALTKGGPGKNYATINVKSQSGKPLSFTIKFFGH